MYAGISASLRRNDASEIRNKEGQRQTLVVEQVPTASLRSSSHPPRDSTSRGFPLHNGLNPKSAVQSMSPSRRSRLPRNSQSAASSIHPDRAESQRRGRSDSVRRLRRVEDACSTPETSSRKYQAIAAGFLQEPAVRDSRRGIIRSPTLHGDTDDILALEGFDVGKGREDEGDYQEDVDSSEDDELDTGVDGDESDDDCGDERPFERGHEAVGLLSPQRRSSPLPVFGHHSGYRSAIQRRVKPSNDYTRSPLSRSMTIGNASILDTSTDCE